MQLPEISESTTFPARVKSILKHAVTSGKRRGAWFALETREKALLSLAIRLEVKFSSMDLLRALASVLKKLEGRGETMHAWLQRGTKLAWSFSEFAASTGNKSAVLWRHEPTYAEYLGRIFVVTPGGRSFG